MKVIIQNTELLTTVTLQLLMQLKIILADSVLTHNTVLCLCNRCKPDDSATETEGDRVNDSRVMSIKEGVLFSCRRWQLWG